MSKLVFNNRNNTFFQQLKADVDAYFQQNKIAPTGDIRLYLKSFILLGTALGLYLTLMLWQPSTFLAIGCCALLGFLMSCIGFSVMHDANHGSYSQSNRLNDFMGLIASNGLGANAFFWKQKHNIIHHTYTNVDGLDDDIAKSPIIRQCTTQPWKPFHRIQHVYMVLVYSLTTLFWVFVMDFTKYFGRKIYRTPAWKMTWINHLVFWGTKVYYITVFIVLPIQVWGVGAWFIGYMIMNAMMGLSLAIVFQLAHVVEDTTFEYVEEGSVVHLETAWAEHQVRTTANFAMGNRVLSWFVGGLNYQIEHHLFPKVSHVHYPAISAIVQKHCVENNIPYNHHVSFWQAVGSHFRMMRDLGKPPALN
jgi:linoleoyl-CoA desaturase